MGIVIGEIVEVGDDVMFYYGVMFGGMFWNFGKCYFIFEDGVLVGVGVKIFGFIMVGVNCCIGVNLVVIEDMLFGMILVGIFVCIVKLVVEWWCFVGGCIDFEYY